MRRRPPWGSLCRGRCASGALAASVHSALRCQHGIEVPVAYAGGRLWCRISAQFYNELSGKRRWGGGGAVPPARAGGAGSRRGSRRGARPLSAASAQCAGIGSRGVCGPAANLLAMLTAP